MKSSKDRNGQICEEVGSVVIRSGRAEEAMQNVVGLVLGQLSLLFKGQVITEVIGNDLEVTGKGLGPALELRALHKRALL